MNGVNLKCGFLPRLLGNVCGDGADRISILAGHSRPNPGRSPRSTPSSLHLQKTPTKNINDNGRNANNSPKHKNSTAVPAVAEQPPALMA